ncbi:Uncharacterised protein [Mycobacterium tuberculosis]|uniref:Uncharacterized protein n=1 Tax=Mycobacterium tuberculosis TaxID=1773 RepID=A0A0T9BHA7_MYCTX|nr:Uncharacterised protein [Mycobacterium tuberculosis]CFA90800.1 Uncharacterised protein [Mycobacterium tuberculosis]CFB91685.1 Uncharacterised protein [Mycobacterium tuberculosis]CFE39104.1 Uncharacterised protein [Mycobacterium tuberculosis]CFR70682.1 Uncharacterised protein [Mycobacterium tuberculosis]
MSVSSAYDQSIDARNVCWRCTVLRAPPVSRRNRSSKLLAISFGDNDRNRAAANSIARGIPSSRRQISLTASKLSATISKLGWTRRARSVNNWIASFAGDNDGTTHVTSPVTPIDSRLVAKMLNSGQAPSSSTTSSAHASNTCSQLSNTISMWQLPMA